MVLPNVVDTEEYVPGYQESKDNVKRFMHISCFEDRSKNISGLLRTISKLALIRTDFECTMVGEGIDLQQMQKLAKDMSLNEPIVRFTGLLEGVSLVKAYQSAGFMVMFSNYENMPVVISESFACGLPVVATSVGGIPEYVNEMNGLLVKAGDEDALLDALCYMLDHYNEFDKQKIRDEAIRTFSRQAVAEKLKELYSLAAN